MTSHDDAHHSHIAAREMQRTKAAERDANQLRGLRPPSLDALEAAAMDGIGHLDGQLWIASKAAISELRRRAEANPPSGDANQLAADVRADFETVESALVKMLSVNHPENSDRRADLYDAARDALDARARLVGLVGTLQQERDDLGNDLARERAKPGGSFDQWDRLQRTEQERDTLFADNVRAEARAEAAEAALAEANQRIAELESR